VSTGAAGIRTLAFGDLDAGVWGAALHSGGSFLVLGTSTGARSLSPSVRIEGSGPAERWSITGEGVELLIEPVPEPLVSEQDTAAPADTAPADTATPADTAAPERPARDSADFDQLCRVRVNLTRDGVERTIECSGTRWSRPDLDLDRFDSLRAVGGSFGPGDAIAILSLRPRGKRGHDADLVSAAVFERGSGTPVSDARFSTTYSAEGVPSRLSLELWQGEGEDEYPLRAAGETAGQGAGAEQGALALRAELFRLHSHDLEAAGVYLLVRSR
jgi:hypothetical protein